MRSNQKAIPSYNICITGNPNSCLIKIQKQKLRALIDSGAEVSLMHRKVFDSLKKKPKLKNRKAFLQSVNGSELTVDGLAEISFEIGGLRMSHPFYVVNDMNRNLILGKDWLFTRGVRVYYDLGCIRVNNVYVPLQEDIHISSIARLCTKTKIPPQSSVICKCKLKENPAFPSFVCYQVSSVETGLIGHEPGLLVTNSISKLRNNRHVPVVLVNTTNKAYTLRKGCPIAKLEQVDLASISSVSQTKTQKQNSKLDFSQVDAPQLVKQQLFELLQSNSDLFAQQDSELSHTDTVKMKIDTGDHSPIKLRPYRTPLNNRKVIDQAIDEMLDAEIITRSKSPWSFPVVIVDKKDGSKRFCVDFRALNKITKPNSYPLPVIDDILALLGQAKFFTSLDLKSGYWQVLMDEKDKEKTAFACHRGLFQFNVMPFGLTNAPAIFQELMATVLSGLNGFTTAYLDDILIFSTTLEEHLDHIQQVFDRLRQHQLRLKLKKCNFLKAETNYLGFVINSDGISPDPKKVEIIKSLPSPTCVKEVRSFIGMASYYRRFIPNFSEIAKPIVALTKKYAKFKWDIDCQTAFDCMKRQLSSLPILGYPDTNKPYILYTDASNSCIGACLTQPIDRKESESPVIRNEKPIYYLSHKLSDTQTRWSTIEKEAFAIHYALQKLDHYLHNAEFTIRTDHKPLKYLLESPMQNKKIQLWALGIAGYNCKIEYVAGTDNSCADLLSRVPKDALPNNESDYEPDISDKTYQVNALNSNRFKPKEYARCTVDFQDPVDKPTLGSEIDIIAEQEKDELLMEIKIGLQNDKISPSIAKRYLLSENILYYISNVESDPILRLYIPIQLRPEVILQYHDYNGHMGVDKTYDSVKLKYYWPNMYKELHNYISSCVTCQKRSAQKSKPPLQETDIPPYAFAKIGLDLSGPYPTSLSGNKYIISFIDLYSGYPEAFPVPDKSADNIAHLLIDEIFPRYGAPLEIITDNGSENINRVVRETLQALNIHHVTTSFYHPQGNAKVERFHRTLHDVLSKKLKDNFNTWDVYLNQTLAAIRFNVNESSKFSPFFLLFNRDVVLPLDNILKPCRKYLGEDTHQIALEQQHKSFLLVHKNLKQAKKRQAYYANKNAKDVKFAIGDPVYYRNHLRKNKLEMKWKPYYRIIEQTSPVTYIIKNQLDGSTTKVHMEHIRLAHVDDWQLPTDKVGRVLRPTNYVVPPISQSDLSSDTENETDDDIPLSKLAHRYRKERENSDNESDIPLMELKKRIRGREHLCSPDGTDTMSPDSDSSSGESVSQSSTSDSNESANESDMAVDQVHVTTGSSTRQIRKSVHRQDRRRVKMKQLLKTISGLL